MSLNSGKMTENMKTRQTIHYFNNFHSEYKCSIWASIANPASKLRIF